VALAGHRSKLYVGGGGGASGFELSSFDPSAVVWETLPTFSGKGRDRHGMASLEDGNLYVWGGRDYYGAFRFRLVLLDFVLLHRGLGQQHVYIRFQERGIQPDVTNWSSC